MSSIFRRPSSRVARRSIAARNRRKLAPRVFSAAASVSSISLSRVIRSSASAPTVPEPAKTASSSDDPSAVSTRNPPRDVRSDRLASRPRALARPNRAVRNAAFSAARRRHVSCSRRCSREIFAAKSSRRARLSRNASTISSGALVSGVSRPPCRQTRQRRATSRLRDLALRHGFARRVRHVAHRVLSLRARNVRVRDDFDARDPQRARREVARRSPRSRWRAGRFVSIRWRARGTAP